MSYMNSQPKIGVLHRYSAKRVSKPFNFICQAPGAKQVSIIGDFNNWDPKVHVMKRQPDGAWMLQILLTHGHHRYLFSVDGEPQLDPRAQGIARLADGNRVSLVAIS